MECSAGSGFDLGLGFGITIMCNKKSNKKLLSTFIQDYFKCRKILFHTCRLAIYSSLCVYVWGFYQRTVSVHTASRMIIFHHPLSQWSYQCWNTKLKIYDVDIHYSSDCRRHVKLPVIVFNFSLSDIENNYPHSTMNTLHLHRKLLQLLPKDNLIIQPRLNKMALLCLEAYISGLEAAIGTCRDIFGFLRFSAFILTQEQDHFT